MKKKPILLIAVLISGLFFIACNSNKKGTEIANSELAPPPPPPPPPPPAKNKENPEPVNESLQNNSKGIGVSAQPMDMATPDDMPTVMPVEEIKMPPMTKEEEAALRKRIEEAWEKKKKKGGK